MVWRIGGLRKFLTRRDAPGPVSRTESFENGEDFGELSGDGSIVRATMKSLWTGAIPVAGQKILPPDPRMMRTIGLNHSFESAVADIIDNSIDAKATEVLVRFMRGKGRILGLCIVDNGLGMDDDAIDRAMTIGGRRDYSANQLGHFGIGLKAASLGQARELTVLSKSAGASAVGRRWLMENAADGFSCDTLDANSSEDAINRYWEPHPQSGTVVMWTDVKSFPHIDHANSLDRLIDARLTILRHHLGLVFHRLISSGQVQIGVDVEDADTGETGIRFSVEAIDPFGYVKSGRKDYPRLLKARLDNMELDLRCHIWPGRSNHPSYRLPGGRPDQFQGFFVYRNDRLLQHGGWNGVLHPDKDLQLARVELNIRADQAALFEMNPEKTRIEPSPHFGSIVQSACDGACTFIKYVEDAKTTYRDSQKRKRERPKVVRPGRGLDEAIRDAVSEEYEFLPLDALSIRWVDLKGDTFFDIDRQNMVIRLNKRYRATVLGQREGSLNDAPLVKALIYLLVEEAFRGAVLSSKTKERIAIWQSILTSAVQAEKE